MNGTIICGNILDVHHQSGRNVNLMSHLFKQPHWTHFSQSVVARRQIALLWAEGYHHNNWTCGYGMIHIATLLTPVSSATRWILDITHQLSITCVSHIIPILGWYKYSCSYLAVHYTSHIASAPSIPPHKIEYCTYHQVILHDLHIPTPCVIIFIQQGTSVSTSHGYHYTYRIPEGNNRGYREEYFKCTPVNPSLSMDVEWTIHITMHSPVIHNRYHCWYQHAVGIWHLSVARYTRDFTTITWQ